MILGCWPEKIRGCAALVAALVVPAMLLAAQQAPGPRDTLVYKDGDRVHGVLVERTAGGVIVFKSDRFG